MKKGDLISVVLAVYNGEKYLHEAIASVISQSYGNLELIIVDDGSTDTSKDIIQAFNDERIRYFYQANQGQPRALNNGISNAKGKYLTFIDADDLWDRDRLSVQYSYLQDHPDIDLLFSHIRQFISPELTDAEKENLFIPKVEQPGISKISLFCLTSCFMKVGMFSDAYAVGDFIEWYNRAKELNLNTEVLKSVLAHRRIHKSNMGIVQAHKRGEFARIMKAALDKRRSRHS